VTEPDVTLTDYALALECAALAVAIGRRQVRDRPLRFWFALFFAVTAIAALLGGTVHGFLLDPENRWRDVVWLATMLAIGVASLAAWNAGTRLLLPRAAGALSAAGWLTLAVYVAVLLLVTQRFWVAIAFYLPAVMALLAGFVAAWRRSPSAELSRGVIGVALVFPAALVQQLRIALHPVYFNHNALYHLIQGVAFFLIFLGARGTLARPSLVEESP
jgi:MFS family permease